MKNESARGEAARAAIQDSLDRGRTEEKSLETNKVYDGKWNPLSSVPDGVSKALDSGPQTRSMILEAIYSGTFDGVPDTGSLEHELIGREWPESEAEVLAPWLMEKRAEYLEQVGSEV